MEQHAVPHQITTFEFKLIGFMTLKQFLYLLVFSPTAYIVMNIFPIPLLNILLAAFVAFFGIALAFIPINDRPMDVYIKNFIKRVFSPTQYYYQKTKPLTTSPITTYDKQKNYESKQKLINYIFTQKKEDTNLEKKEKDKKQEITKALNNTDINNLIKDQEISQNEASFTIATPQTQKQQITEKKPFLVGVVKNKKETLLPGILVYIKDQNSNILRLLKTNPYGIFQSYNSLPNGIYDIEIKDPNQNHVFDKIKIELKEENPKIFEFFSKELI